MAGAVLTPLTGGMNSETWLVSHQESTFVAKRVEPRGVPDLIAGCEVAAALAKAGVVTGAPVPTSDGSLLLLAQGLALLEYVPGRELDGETDEEQEWMAYTLAAVHRASSPSTGPSPSGFMAEWLDRDLPGVGAHPWLISAIESVRAEIEPLQLTLSVLHTDPAPEAFLHDDQTRTTGLVDWAGAKRGPILYDVASAVMYLGRREHAVPFLDAYAEHGAADAAALEHLDGFRRFREVIQATYFTARTFLNDLTGAIDPSENVKGLQDARRRLALLGIATS
jgi:Ser/Thr protein kinase RdoA (MazF antagonist)